MATPADRSPAPNNICQYIPPLPKQDSTINLHSQFTGLSTHAPQVDGLMTSWTTRLRTITACHPISTMRSSCNWSATCISHAVSSTSGGEASSWVVGAAGLYSRGGGAGSAVDAIDETHDDGAGEEEGEGCLGVMEGGSKGILIDRGRSTSGDRWCYDGVKEKSW